MTITQTVEIPDSRRFTVEVPCDAPTGTANIIIQFPVKPAKKIMTDAEELESINRMVEMRKNEIMENMEYQAMFLEELEK